MVPRYRAVPGDSRQEEVHPRALRPQQGKEDQPGAGGRGEHGPQRQPGEEHVPFQHVPRHPHADERHRGLYHAGNRQRRRHGKGERLPLQDSLIEQPSALADRRRAGHEPHRERKVPSGGVGGESVCRVPRHPHDHHGADSRQAAGAAHGRVRRDPRGRLLRQDAPQSGAAQPALQRDQVHAGGRQNCRGAHGACERAGGEGALRDPRAGQRHRHEFGVCRADF